MILDARDLLVGRFATVVAKRALLGEQVVVVNCEKAYLSGRKRSVIEAFQQRRRRGAPLKGPYFPRRPDMLVRRMIRGMLPHKQPKGSAAFKRIMCYIGVPENFKEQKCETIPEASVEKLPNLKFISIRELCDQLGAP